jgi:leucyl aminopeptidase
MSRLTEAPGQPTTMGRVKNWTVSVSDSPASSLTCDALILGVAATDDGVEVCEASLGPDHREAFAQWVGALSLSAGVDEAKKLPAPAGFVATSVVLVGLPSTSPTADELRYAAGAGARAAGDASDIAVALPFSDSQDTVATIEGALLGAHKTAKLGKTDTPAGSRSLVVRGVVGEQDLDTAVASAEAVAWVRDLVTEPPNTLYPETFAARVADFADGAPVSLEVFDEKALAAGGFGGILGVGQGSSRPPRLVAVRYQPANPSGHIALVGKGITFDSGGLSLKPANSMVGMKYDMTGAATVAGAVIAAARMGAPVQVTGWLCLAENMPSGTALRPNDVITIRGGKTVEVLNTDAEGRLVMADGLQRASEDTPDLIIDIATLTGAARVALGERYAGLMGDDHAVEVVAAAAKESGETVWPMPLAGELRTLLDSDVADIANAKPGNSLGGMLLAGLFLKEFVGRRNPDDNTSALIPWAHVDMAGPASNSSGPFGYTPKGATGALTRTLIALLRAGDTHVTRLAQQ